MTSRNQIAPTMTSKFKNGSNARNLNMMSNLASSKSQESMLTPESKLGMRITPTHSYSRFTRLCKYSKDAHKINEIMGSYMRLSSQPDQSIDQI